MAMNGIPLLTRLFTDGLPDCTDLTQRPSVKGSLVAKWLTGASVCYRHRYLSHAAICIAAPIGCNVPLELL